MCEVAILTIFLVLPVYDSDIGRDDDAYARVRARIVEQKVEQRRLVDLATIRPNRGGLRLKRAAVDDDPAASSP
jgi:hypothetical protein